MILRRLLVSLHLLLLLGMLLCELLSLLLVFLLYLLFLCLVGVLLRQFLVFLLLLLLEFLAILLLLGVEFFLLLLVFLVGLGVARIWRSQVLCRREFVRMDGRLRRTVLCVARWVIAAPFACRYCAVFVEGSWFRCCGNGRLPVICGSTQFRIGTSGLHVLILMRRRIGM